MSKIGLVVEGGGMRGIYGAGVLDRFLDENLEFPYCIGVSAGSANIISFLSRQRGRNYRYYRYHAKHKKYMGLENAVRSGSYMGLEYIYDTLTNNLDALDYDTLLSTNTTFKFAAARAGDAKTIYFDNSDISLNDCRILMASSAVPAINKPVVINGVEYFDGGITDPIPFEKAVDDGCEKLVVILSRTRGYIKKPENFKFIYSRLLSRYPEIIKALNRRHILYNETVKRLYSLEKEGRAVIIAPSAHVKLSMVGTDSSSMDRLYKYALNDAEYALNSIYSL